VTAVSRPIAAIVRRCHAGLDALTLFGEVLRLLPALVPFDTGFLATTDPSTLLFTGGLPVDPSHGRDVVSQFLANEYLDDDVMKFRDLASAPQPVEWLGRSTRGEPEMSPRYQQLFRPQGMGDELRAAFVAFGACWGVMCIAREKGAPGFDEREARVIAQLTPHIGEALRAAVVLRDARRPNPDADGPGVLVLTADRSIAAATPAAIRWLAELEQDGPRTSGELPVAVTSVVSSLEACTGPTVNASVQPRVHALARSGQWLVIHGSSMVSDDREAATAIVIEPARRAALVPLLMPAHGLTPRESEVTRLVLLGLSTRQICHRLHVSEYTVQDHLKSIFSKLGAGSRRELITCVLNDHEPPL
jgi:DNA-binding CsgD family transcriptional regulator